MKYKILFDYGSEGLKFYDKDFDTIDEAVKIAIGFYTIFFIITIIDWKAMPINKEG